MNRLPDKRRGMVLILVLACITVAAVLLAIGVKLAVTNHRITQTFGWSVQAQWLAESGLQLAAAKLSGDSAYAGETWKIPAENLDGFNAAIVNIEVKSIDDQSKSRLVIVQAVFPDDPYDRVQYSKELTLELP
jgi:type II secretory pathway component PulK